jgi:GT2 family glycosyltransferase
VAEPLLDILLPTCNRPASLVMTLSGVAAQTLVPLRLVVADQSDEPQDEEPVVRSLLRIIEAHGGEVEWHSRPQVHGIAEQRNFLLGKAGAPYVLYLDDDVFMEPWVSQRLVDALLEQACGFVGAFPTGLSFRDDVRPEQERIEFWDGLVRPEALEPEGPGWERCQLHRAANLFHVAQRLRPDESRLYKVAWVASCVAYDRRKLEAVGGFSFWRDLPRYHSGEEVLVQNLLMRRWGGCGIVPPGTYHSELPSTVLNEQGSVDGHALALLPGLASRFTTLETRRI